MYRLFAVQCELKFSEPTSAGCHRGQLRAVIIISKLGNNRLLILPRYLLQVVQSLHPTYPRILYLSLISLIPHTPSPTSSPIVLLLSEVELGHHFNPNEDRSRSEMSPFSGSLRTDRLTFN